MANNSEFWERYQDPRWQRKRLEIMQRDNWKCKCCGTDGDTLNVHHAYYERDAMPWEYPDHALVTLCKVCHERKHEIKQKLLLLLAHFTEADALRILGYATAKAAVCYDLAFTISTIGEWNGVIDYFGGPSPNDRWYDVYEQWNGKPLDGNSLLIADAFANRHDEAARDLEYEQLSYAAYAFNG